ncbi:MAG: glutamine synthetase family protein [Promethearchaeati archaeon SRVP18_Atabeyarchaeia-1]
MSEKIEYIEMRTVDILGRLRAMIVPCKPADTIDELQLDPAMTEGTSIDGSSVLGFASVEHSDLRLDPDPSSLVELPYTPQRRAATMCFVHEKGGKARGQTYHPRDTRGVLHRVCKEYLSDGATLRTKVEPEFYFITEDGVPFDQGGYAETYPADPAADVLLGIASGIQKVGMRPHVAHHEAGAAQHEIEIEYDDAMKMADNVVLFKSVAHAITRKAGFGVTFMPKPFQGGAGSGLHCHLQLWEGGKNLFGDQSTNGLSNTAKMFAAGLLEHAPAITAVANPTINSYKRLVPNHEAPVYVSWGPVNRTVLVRVPLFTSSQKAAIEIRSPDPTTNPYLLFSALVAAGMDGINRKLAPPDPTSEDVFRLTAEQREQLGIRPLPISLVEALDNLANDECLMKALGRELVDTYVDVQRREWSNYISEAVTDWEWEHYRDS